MTDSSPAPRSGLILLIACILCALCAAVFAAAQRPSKPTGAMDPPARRIRFSGFEWTVKSSDHTVGPGPNFFSDSGENVWVDGRGYLHMRITYRDGRWWCAEIICACSPGFGTYAFRIPAETIRGFDANAVLGLFNWSDDPAFAHREIDLELSRWGQKGNPNAQFVVQPYERPGHISRFELAAGGPATLTYSWLSTRVLFKALNGSGRLLRNFEFRGDVPAPGGNPRINLWLLGGQPPQEGAEVHIVVESFSFEKP
jgi:hypothetical protein